jgi:hypothetical protein
VLAATATAARPGPGCSDLRGELQALALSEEEGQGLVAERYLSIPSSLCLAMHAPIKHLILGVKCA